MKKPTWEQVAKAALSACALMVAAKKDDPDEGRGFDEVLVEKAHAQARVALGQKYRKLGNNSIRGY